MALSPRSSLIPSHGCPHDFRTQFKCHPPKKPFFEPLSLDSAPLLYTPIASAPVPTAAQLLVQGPPPLLPEGRSELVPWAARTCAHCAWTSSGNPGFWSWIEFSTQLSEIASPLHTPIVLYHQFSIAFFYLGTRLFSHLPQQDTGIMRGGLALIRLVPAAFPMPGP